MRNTGRRPIAMDRGVKTKEPMPMVNVGKMSSCCSVTGPLCCCRMTLLARYRRE